MSRVSQSFFYCYCACYVMLCYIMLRQSYYVILCHVMLCYTMLCYYGDRGNLQNRNVHTTITMLIMFSALFIIHTHTRSHTLSLTHTHTHTLISSAPNHSNTLPPHTTHTTHTHKHTHTHSWRRIWITYMLCVCGDVQLTVSEL